MKKVSVIIPIYNTAPYLERCLSSITLQTYGDLEIICVDDGSTDGSGRIVDQFAERDKRVVALHQQNAGVSSARNAGLKQATGDYIAFCDSDDWIEADMYQQMAEVMESENLDMVAVGWYKDSDEEKEEIRNRLPVSHEIIGRDLLLEYLYKRDYYRGFAFICTKLFRREILLEPSGKFLEFDEKLVIGEDVLYLAEVAINIKKTKYIDRAFYHYIQRNSSGSHTKDLYKLRDWVRAYERIISLFEKSHVENNTVNYVKRFLVYISSKLAQMAYEQNDTEMLKTSQNFMRMYEKEYLDLNKEYPERVLNYNKIMLYQL